MAIRFQCPSCAQPIEVDDDLASRLVACPYCRKTVTAPATSTLSDPSQVPVAVPLAPASNAHGAQRTYAQRSDVPAGAWPDGAHYYPPPPNASGNALAIVAFALACTTLLMFLSAGIILSNHSVEFEEFMKLVEEHGTTVAGQMKAWNEFLERRGGVSPTWFFAFTALSFASMALSVVALVCGLVAVRRPQRRGFAMAALGITGLYAVLMCGGMLAG